MGLSSSPALGATVIDQSRNTITYHNALCVCHSNILYNHCLQFLLGGKIAPRESENKFYAKFWGDKQRALWCVMVFSGVINCSREFRVKLFGHAFLVNTD